jgi:hypothetical protein
VVRNFQKPFRPLDRRSICILINIPWETTYFLPRFRNYKKKHSWSVIWFSYKALARFEPKINCPYQKNGPEQSFNYWGPISIFIQILEKWSKPFFQMYKRRIETNFVKIIYPILSMELSIIYSCLSLLTKFQGLCQWQGV